MSAVAPPAAAHPADVYEFEGSGWGHSVGLSQYGAYGQALEGRTAQEILRHYYRGVNIETIDQLVADGDIAADHTIVTDGTPLWVGVVQNATSITIAPVGGEVRFCQSVTGVGVCEEVGRTDAGDAEVWKFAETEVDGQAGCLLTRVTPAPDGAGPIPFGSCRASIIWDDSTADRVGIEGAVCSGNSGIGRNCFSRGTLRIRDDGVTSGFHVALEIELEQYLYGLGEMPSEWPSEALRAQAIAGRAYAVYRLLGNDIPSLATGNDAGLSAGRKAACWCHIYSTVKDQSYVAYAKEVSNQASRWIDAVNATAGEVVTHPTATSVNASVVIAFYHSSSGGITETNTAVWGTSSQPYLQSVDDAWSNAPAVNNPFESWTVRVTAGELAGLLGWDSVEQVVLANGAPAASFTFTGTNDGAAVTDNVTAAALYALLGTRSPHIDSVTVDPYYPFGDIDGSVHASAIVQLWDAGITNGCTDELFCPERPLSRAQMATFLARVLGLEPIDQPTFVDVAEDSVHAPSINAVAAAGITVGCDTAGSLFCPEEVVSRAQMASFLARALELEPVAEGPFQDLTEAAGHQRNINALWEAGITRGCSALGSSYCPTDPMTRAQTATFIDRAFLGGVGDLASVGGRPEQEPAPPSQVHRGQDEGEQNGRWRPTVD